MSKNINTESKVSHFLVGLIVCICIVIAAIASGIIFSDAHEGTFYNLKNIAPYTYEITFNDYMPDTELKTIDKTKVNPACSGVRNGNFVGRNFDYVYNDTPEFIVKMNSNENRYASIGIAQHWGLRDKELSENKYNNDDLEIIPNLTLDGINEKGLVCTCNVVPSHDTGKLTGTNPGGEAVHILNVCRKLLDRAKNTNEAISLLKEFNIFGELGNKYYLHYMISDYEHTYIVELLDNKVVVQEKFDNDRVMTNYYNNLPELTDNAQGVERAIILKVGYNEGSTFDGMFSLMRRASFAGLPEQTAAYGFLTDMGMPYTESRQYNDIQKDAFIDEYRKFYVETINNEDARKKADDSFWITVHNSTYDIENLKMMFCFQQDYDRTYNYVINWTMSLTTRKAIFWAAIIVGILAILAGSFCTYKHKKNKN